MSNEPGNSRTFFLAREKSFHREDAKYKKEGKGIFGHREHRGHRGKKEIGDTQTERVIGAAVEVHRILGPGLLESIYEQALCFEFELQNILFQRQVDVEVHYKGRVIKGQRIDLIVGGELVVELKAVTSMPEIVTAQVLSYLKATGLKRALVLNFGASRLIDGLK